MDTAYRGMQYIIVIQNLVTLTSWLVATINSSNILGARCEMGYLPSNWKYLPIATASLGSSVLPHSTWLSIFHRFTSNTFTLEYYIFIFSSWRWVNWVPHYCCLKWVAAEFASRAMCSNVRLMCRGLLRQSRCRVMTLWHARVMAVSCIFRWIYFIFTWIIRLGVQANSLF